VRRSVTEEEAFIVLEQYFTALKRTFVEEGAERLEPVRLEIAPWVHDSPRHFAATAPAGNLIVAAPELAELPEETVVAILAHECGHATDFLYPGDYQLMDDGELIRLPPVPAELIDERAAQANLARMRAWRRRDEDTIERAADAIAECFTGRVIGYCGPCSLQCFDRGRPRPRGVR
jgi:hypothetical protein